MKINLYKIAFIASTIIFIGCDGENTYDYRVENQTAKTIRLEFKNAVKYSDSVEIVEIQSNNSKLIYTYNIITSSNPAPDHHKDTVTMFSFLNVVGYDSLKSIKILRSRNEWSFQYRETWAEYRLVIDTTDFYR